MNRKYFLTGFVVFTSTLLFAQPQVLSETSDGETVLNMLQEGGHVIYFRHAERAQPSSVDSRLPEEFSSCLFPDVLLTEGGVESMRLLGQQFNQLNIPVGEVVSSPACRCIESAWFGFGKVVIDSSLDGVYDRDDAGDFIINETVTEEYAMNLRRALVTMPEEGSNTLLFAHSSNILALTGLELEQGEAAIFKPDGQGHFTYVSRLSLDEWENLME
ncbi:MAG: hypothetical protein AAGF01_26920 [Cyanobacteria bacterium P01_G01_bin.38]